MINLYFKGGVSGISEGTMITSQSESQDDIYKALKNSGCDELKAKTAKYRGLWETAQEREKRMAKQSASSNSKGKAKATVAEEVVDDTMADELVAAYSNEDLDDDDLFG